MTRWTPAIMPSQTYKSHQVRRQLSSRTGLPLPCMVAKGRVFRLISKAIRSQSASSSLALSC